jgi:hypothetical protein
MDLKDIEYQSLDWIHLPQSMNQHLALLKTVTEVQVPKDHMEDEYSLIIYFMFLRSLKQLPNFTVESAGGDRYFSSFICLYLNSDLEEQQCRTNYNTFKIQHLDSLFLKQYNERKHFCTLRVFWRNKHYWIIQDIPLL